MAVSTFKGVIGTGSIEAVVRSDSTFSAAAAIEGRRGRGHGRLVPAPDQLRHPARFCDRAHHHG